MALATTVRPHSSSNSASSTPWLSPEPSSSTWRGSYTASAELNRQSHPASTSFSTMSSGSVSSRDPHSQEWWEHVLPPGQLAERLRKAQRSSSSSRRRNNPALANATPSERSAWKRLSGLPTEKRQHTQSESSTAASSRRSSYQAGSAATLPRSALKSSHRSHDQASSCSGAVSQSESSAEVSSDEFGGISTGQHTPQNHIHFAFPTGDEHGSTLRRSGVKTMGNSPEMVSSTSWSDFQNAEAFEPSHSFSRSTSGRRMRVMSEDGMASTIFASAHSSSFTASSAYRLPVSQSAMHLGQLAGSNPGDSASWASIANDQNRTRLAQPNVSDTPELSSDDGADSMKFSTITTQRVRKTSTTRTTVRTSTSSSSNKVPSPPTILRSHFDRPDQPPCSLGSEDTDGYTSPANRRDRHVSFDQASELPRRASVHDHTEPLTSSQSAFSFDTSSPFDSLPPRSNSTRRPRQGVRTTGRRTTSFSLPSSRRGSIRGDSPFQHGAAPSTSAASSSSHHRRASSIPDAVLLESLHVAHKQLASAGNLALTLTRQLSAPLRPVFHMTLFLSISSITVLSLAAFLCASYMLTAWDDVSTRTQKVGAVAGRTKQRFEKTLDWMMGPGQVSASSKANETTSGSRTPREASSTASPKASESERRGPVLAAGHAFLWPARMAFSATTTIAHTITPPSITKIFAESEPKPRASSSLPPRPPLSTLLPSILFTLLLAMGAGLTSFWASRKQSAGRDMPGASGGAQPYNVGSGTSSPGVQYAGMAADAQASPFAGRGFQSARMNVQDGVGGRRTFAYDGVGGASATYGR